MLFARPWLAVVGCSLALGVPAVVVAQEEEEPRAKAARLFEEAEIHYRLQEFDDALAKYKEAYRLSQEAALLFNLGQCYRQMGRYEEALKAYKTFLRDQPGTPLKTDIEALIVELENLVAKTKTVAKAKPDPSLSEKGGISTASGAPPESQPAVVTPPPDPVVTEPETPVDTRQGPSPLIFYGAAGGAAVLSLTLGGAAFSAARQASDLQAQDNTNIDEVAAKFRSARILGVASDVLLVSAIGAGVGGFLFSRRAASSERAATVTLSPAGVAFVASF